MPLLRFNFNQSVASPSVETPNPPHRAAALVPRAGLQAWSSADQCAPVAGTNWVDFVPDLSTNNRALTCAGTSGYPLLIPNALNGQPVFRFDGVCSPLIHNYRGFAFKSAFIVASAADGAFNEYRGLLTDTQASASGGLAVLVSKNAGTEFFDNQYGANYRKSDVLLPSSAMTAPMSGAEAVLEASRLADLNFLTGFQIGQDRQAAVRKWRGDVAEWLIYDRILSDCERRGMYQYFAAKYNLWRKTATGLNIFPFPLNWNSPQTAWKKTLESISVSNAYKARTKTGLLKNVDANFSVRRQFEYEAAEIFWNNHYPGVPCAIEDTTFFPPRIVAGRIAGELQRESNSPNNQNYKFSFVTSI